MFYFLGALLKNAGNDCHLSGNVADFSGNRSDTPDDGNDFLLQEPLLFGLIGTRKAHRNWVCVH